MAHHTGEDKEKEEEEYRFFAGIRSDPFFFDMRMLEGMKNGTQFTSGADTFLDKNVFSIILEVPNSALGRNPKVGIWYRVLIPKDGHPFFQIDRMGRPFVSTAFTKEGDRNTFNRIEPTEDRKLFTKKFSDLLESFGHSSDSAQKTALALLPDILDYEFPVQLFQDAMEFDNIGKIIKIQALHDGTWGELHGHGSRGRCFLCKITIIILSNYCRTTKNTLMNLIRYILLPNLQKNGFTSLHLSLFHLLT